MTAARTASLPDALPAPLFPTLLLPCFLVPCVVLPLPLEELHIPLGFMKLYVQDAVLGLNMLLAFYLLLTQQNGWARSPLHKWFAVFHLVGAFGLAYGLSRSNGFDSTFGDYRRAFFYLLNFHLTLLLCPTERHVRRVAHALALGSGLAILNGMMQLLLGDFYTRRFSDAAHILSKFEIQFLSFGMFYGLARLFEDGVPRRWMWAALAAGGVLVTIIGNFRSSWLSLGGGLMFVYAFMPARYRLRLAAVGIASALAGALAVALLWNVEVSETSSTLGEEIMKKASVENASFDPNVTWRIESYAKAAELWRQNPVLGTGLGVVMEFSGPTSTGGAMLVYGHRVHNSFLWVLMSTGVVGFTVLLVLHTSYLWSLVRALRRRITPPMRSLILACGAFHIAFLISTGFEIFLESGIPVTLMAVCMALAQWAATSAVEVEDTPSSAVGQERR